MGYHIVGHSNLAVHNQWHSHQGSRGADCSLDSEKICQKSEKEGENQEKIGKKRKNPEGAFTLPLLTDRASYAAVYNKIWRAVYRYLADSLASYKEAAIPTANVLAITQPNPSWATISSSVNPFSFPED